MDTVFSHIVQKRFSQVNEDVATDALAFILHSSESARNGFMKLLRGLEANLPTLQFRTQQSEDNIRPDMWGFDGSDPRVFVENKFWAGLTDNQPVSYLRQLAEFKQPTVLLVVVPAAREQTIWRELLARLGKEGISATDREIPTGIVHAVTTEIGSVLALTSWSRLLAAIESEAAEDRRAIGDLLQLRALCDAADSNAFVPVSAEDVSDQRTPAFILQLNMVIQDAVQTAVTEDILNLKGLRTGVSEHRIGRYIRFCGGSRVGAWIGVHFRFWKLWGRTPVWLIFSPDEFGRAAEVRRALELKATGENVMYSTEAGSFCLGLNLVTSEEKDFVVRSIVDDLKRVATALSGLPPAHSSAEPSDE